MENSTIRPTFLTVLCVITFIFSSMSLFSAITNYSSAEVAVGVTKDAMDEAQDKIEESAESENQSDLISKLFGNVTESLTVENYKNMAIASGLASILAILGAVLMWGLNKKGFWLYVAGTLVSILAPLFIYEGIVGAAASGGTAFFGVLFCVLYGLNLKHMN